MNEGTFYTFAPSGHNHFLSGPYLMIYGKNGCKTPIFGVKVPPGMITTFGMVFAQC